MPSAKPYAFPFHEHRFQKLELIRRRPGFSNPDGLTQGLSVPAASNEILIEKDKK